MRGDTLTALVHVETHFFVSPVPLLFCSNKESAWGTRKKWRMSIAAFSLQHRIPAVDGWAPFARAGNLLIYGPVIADVHRRLAVYVDKILKGAKPADLPVELPTKVELVINLKTAKAMGIVIPKSVLVRADEVIE